MKGRLLTSLLTVLTFTGLQAQTLPAPPKLVVGLTIDQLRTDYLEAFSSLYSERGFKRIWREGRVYRNAQYTFNDTDRSSAIASIYTGTTPSLHGIIANRWMDVSTLRLTGSTDDSAYMAYYNGKPSAPTKLLTSTLSDELKIATQGTAIVYAIAPFRDAAILSAGHAANAALWINPTTGKWSGTTFYGEFPVWANQYNDSLSIDYRITEMIWEPLLPQAKYTFLPEWKEEPFKYILNDDRVNKFRKFITTPFANEEVNALAKEAIEKGWMGQDNTPDLLLLTYYAGNYNHKSVQECATEIQDAYVRLDRQIADLLDMLDQKVGLHNVLLCITSTGYTDSESTDSGLYHIPNGEFHLNRCAALLNMYLMATYGEGKFVETYHNQQIYLNHKLLEDKGLNVADVQEKAAEFLVQFSGVNEVYSARRLLLGAWTPKTERIKNGFHRKYSGDLLIEVQPGWNIVNEDTNSNKVIRHSFIPSPLIFMGYSVKAEVIETPVTIDRVAPTLAHFMRIRAPNACQMAPLTGIR